MVVTNMKCAEDQYFIAGNFFPDQTTSISQKEKFKCVSKESYQKCEETIQLLLFIDMLEASKNSLSQLLQLSFMTFP